jgi:hypothetical protein
VPLAISADIHGAGAGTGHASGDIFQGRAAMRAATLFRAASVLVGRCSQGYILLVVGRRHVRARILTSPAGVILRTIQCINVEAFHSKFIGQKATWSSTPFGTILHRYEIEQNTTKAIWNFYTNIRLENIINKQSGANSSIQPDQAGLTQNGSEITRTAW